MCRSKRSPSERTDPHLLTVFSSAALARFGTRLWHAVGGLGEQPCSRVLSKHGETSMEHRRKPHIREFFAFKAGRTHANVMSPWKKRQGTKGRLTRHGLLARLVALRSGCTMFVARPARVGLSPRSDRRAEPARMRTGRAREARWLASSDRRPRRLSERAITRMRAVGEQGRSGATMRGKIGLARVASVPVTERFTPRRPRAEEAASMNPGLLLPRAFCSHLRPRLRTPRRLPGVMTLGDS